jgi:anhydro-N-acetylmuramic acid kinase
MPARWIIGLASGTGTEGAHAAVMELQGAGLGLRLEQLHGLRQAYPPEVGELVRQARCRATCEVARVGRLHRLLGETFADLARAAADGASLPLQKVQAIGCPGHTVGQDLEGPFASTLLLGMPAVIAERTGVTVVGDFRYRDLAAGGLGGPLAALPDYLLFRHAAEGRLLLHLGGLVRAVYLPPGGRPQETTAFEAAPCNVLLDALVRLLTAGREPYDAGGKHAVQGRCVEALLHEWLDHPDLKRRPPRGLPRHAFGEAFAAAARERSAEHDAGPHDLLCTATHFVARATLQALRAYLPPAARVDRVLVSGGGARNGLLWHLLEQGLGAPLARTDSAGVPAELRKALVPGLLAALTLDGVPGNAPAATGAAGSRLLGSITPGATANWARCVQWIAQHSLSAPG